MEKKAQRPLSRRAKFLLLSLFPVYFIAAGLALQPLSEIGPGILAIIRDPDFLITDYFVIGGIGASFLNAGILCLTAIGIIYKLGMEFDGHTITSTFLMFGFSLFGKNLLNIWLIILGIMLYARYHRAPVSKYIYIGFYGTCLSPVITQVMHIDTIYLPLRIFLCIFTGITIGFLLPPLATHVHYAHRGYSLYNVGFAAGLIATVIVSVFKSFGLVIQSRLIWSTGNNTMFLGLLSALFITFMIIGCLSDRRFIILRYRKLLRTPGLGGADYIKSQGIAVTLLNMGINGLLMTYIFVIVGGELNGPTIGSIMTVVGFSATGKHARNISSILLGVWLTSFITKWDISDPSSSLAFILSTNLAPIAGEFGVFAGILSGFLHSSVAINVGIIYGGMNLYNNGFAGGLTAIFLVPVFQSILDRRARAKGGDFSL